MANTSAIWQQAAHATYQLSSPSCSTRPIQKSLTLNEKYLSFLGEKSGEWTISRKNDKTERARGLGRKNKRGDTKGESNDSPEIPNRRGTLDIPSLPSGASPQSPKQYSLSHALSESKKIFSRCLTLSCDDVPSN